MPHVSVADGRRIYWESTGEGRPIVLLNGMSQSTANWLTQTRALSRRARVICFDARGQGRSDLGDTVAEPVSLAGHVADLAELLDSLGCDDVALCGFSHGARVALAFAATHPGRVTRLVMTSMGDHEDAARRTIVRSWLEVLERGGIEAMAWASLVDILGREFLAAHEAHVDAMIRATAQRNTVAGMRALLVSMMAYPSPELDAARVTAPTLLIGSPEDRLVSVASARRLADLIPGAKLSWVEGCGHTVPVERPEAWRSLVEGFVHR